MSTDTVAAEQRFAAAALDDATPAALEDWVIKKLFIFIPVILEDAGNILKSLFAVSIDLREFFGDVGHREIHEFAEIFVEIGDQAFDARRIQGAVVN